MLIAARNIFLSSKKNEPVLPYLTFTAEQAGSVITMATNGVPPTIYLETSTSGKEDDWTDFIVGSTSITLPKVGDKVYFRAKQDNERLATNSVNRNVFKLTVGKVAASGNLNTLLKADGSVVDLTGRDYCFHQLFSNCSALTKAPELPATTLAPYCYEYIFFTCTNLTSAPVLPATTLAEGCYARMFFANSKINSIDVNFNEWIESTPSKPAATSYWFNTPSSSGTFTCPADLPEKRGASYIPNNWTIVRK